ncbi:hypothetical protein [Paludisphaera rhizosphaerae]|uniref:hypothetical protein n=1 Tax=Paludisphaera rhizosphaerae TaxID=2711216 RepID=UPI0013EA60F6|nr:hypothetical protein [Paludisphaera rhizosphaerae]
MATEYLLLVKEDHFGVPVEDPVLGTDAFAIKLSESNAFSMDVNPTIGEIGRGNGDSGISCFYTAQYTCSGTLQGELYPTLAGVLLNWALTPINGGRTAPWATTAGAGSLPIGDLASVSLYHGWWDDYAGVYRRKRYSGVKVLSGSLAASSSDPIWKYNFSLQGIRKDVNAAGSVADPDATEFPFPADTDYPCGPYLWPDLVVGGLKIGTTRADYGNVAFAWTSTINPQFFESKYVKSLRYKGRGNSTTLTVDLAYKTTPDDEAAYQALTAQDTEFTLSTSGHSVKVDLNTNNVISGRTRNFDYGGPFMQNIVVKNAWDKTAGSDLVLTVA